MRLYRLKDVKRAALLRHGSLEGIQDAQRKSAARGSVIKAGKAEKKTARRLEADAACVSGAVHVGCWLWTLLKHCRSFPAD